MDELSIIEILEELRYENIVFEYGETEEIKETAKKRIDYLLDMYEKNYF